MVNCCHASAFCPPSFAGYWGDLIWVVGGCLSRIEQQLFSFETLDWLLCKMLKQKTPPPAPCRAITFFCAQCPHWLTDSFTHLWEVQHVWTSSVWSGMSVCFLFFLSLQWDWYQDMVYWRVHLCQRERLDVLIKLIYCSVSEHNTDSLNF